MNETIPDAWVDIRRGNDNNLQQPMNGKLSKMGEYNASWPR